MTLAIHLSPEATKLLLERAAALGLDPAAYVAKMVEIDLRRPSLEEIMASVREDFARTGMSDEEIMELGRRELDALREEKRAKGAG